MDGWNRMRQRRSLDGRRQSNDAAFTMAVGDFATCEGKLGEHEQVKIGGVDFSEEGFCPADVVFHLAKLGIELKASNPHLSIVSRQNGVTAYAA